MSQFSSARGVANFPVRPPSSSPLSRSGVPRAAQQEGAGLAQRQFGQTPGINLKMIQTMTSRLRS